MSFTSSIFKDALAYQGSVVFINNAGSASFNLITMTNGKSRDKGGAIYTDGTGSASISFSNCATTVSYFLSYSDGGFAYIGNPSTTMSSSNCCYNHLFAVGNGAFTRGSFSGSFTSSCT